MSSVPLSQPSAPVLPKKRRWKPILLRTTLVLFILWLGFVAFMWRTMKQPPEKFATVMSDSAKNDEERAFVASPCGRKLVIKSAALPDCFDNTVEKAYTGWPDRLYLIDRDGRVVYKSRAGPLGFKPDELKAALEKIV